MCLNDAKTWSSLQFLCTNCTSHWNFSSRTSCSACQKPVGTLASTSRFTITDKQFSEQSDIPSGRELLPRISSICRTERHCTTFYAICCHWTWSNDSQLHASTFCGAHITTDDTCFMCYINRRWCGCVWRTLCYIRELLSLLSTGVIHSGNINRDIIDNSRKCIEREKRWRSNGACLYRSVNSACMYFIIISSVLCKKKTESSKKDDYWTDQKNTKRCSNGEYTVTKFNHGGNSGWNSTTTTTTTNSCWNRDNTTRSIITKARSTASHCGDKVYHCQRPKWFTMVAT